MTIRFEGGTFDGQEFVVHHSPPAFILHPLTNYVYAKWEGEPDFVATYRPQSEPLFWDVEAKEVDEGRAA